MNDIHTESNTIISSHPGAVGFMLNELRNYFYAATGAVERHEFKDDVNSEAIMEPIRANLDFAHSPSTFAEMMRQNFRDAGVADKLETIRATAIEVFASIVAERLQGGRIIGNGHHIRQEMSAKALVAVAKKLDLKA